MDEERMGFPKEHQVLLSEGRQCQQADKAIRAVTLEHKLSVLVKDSYLGETPAQIAINSVSDDYNEESRQRTDITS
jgi:uncharacterized membrane protein YkoI